MIEFQPIVYTLYMMIVLYYQTIIPISFNVDRV